MKITFSTLTASDLIVHEQEPYVGYTRATSVVTLAAGDVLQLGSPLFRAKGVAGAKWAPVKAAAALVATNEIAFYLSDVLGQILPIEGVTGDVSIGAIVRGEIVLKDKTIKEALAANGFVVTDPQFTSVKEMAAAQHIIVEKVLG